MMRLLPAIAALLFFAGLPAGAQNVEPKELLHPPPDAWLTYHGEYNGQRHSKLTQITPENIGRLKQVWRFQAGQTLKISPIVAAGDLFSMGICTWA